MKLVALNLQWERVRSNTSLSMLFNSLSLVLAKVAAMGLGFLAWLLAAKFFMPAEVGIASAAVSGIMLCAQVALLGVGSAIIALFPLYKEKPSSLFNSAFSIAIFAALAAAVVFLIYAWFWSDELRVIGTTPLYGLLFLAMSVAGTLTVAFDQTSAALRRGDHALARGVLAGVVTIGFVASLPLLAGATSSLAIFLSWSVGAAAACSLGWLQLWRAVTRYRYRPSVETSVVRQVLRVGLPNYALTLSERAPGLILPVAVIVLLSPEDTAHWYIVWMMALVVFFVPIQIALIQFAESSHQPDSIAWVIRRGIQTSLALGITAAAGILLMAPFMLGLLGESYAAAGTTPLRILVLTVVPFTFIQAYFAACRATRRLLEATFMCAVTGIASIVTALTIGVSHGLSGIATAWLAVHVVAALWSIYRLRSMFSLSAAQSPALESGGFHG